MNRHMATGPGAWAVTLFASVLTLFSLFSLFSLLMQGRAFGETATLIELLDASDLVVRARVLDVERTPSGSRLRGSVRVDERIKGDGSGNRESVAEERRFPSDPEQLIPGREALLFLRALPDESRWEQDRAHGVRFLVFPVDRALAESGPATVMRVTDFLKQYLALSPSGKGARTPDSFLFLIQSLNSPEPAVQAAAAEVLPELDSLPFPVGRDILAGLERFVRDPGRNLYARKRITGKLLKVNSGGTLVSQIVRCCPELRETVLEQMASRGREEELRMEILGLCLQDRDPGVRGKALASLARMRGDAADRRMGEAALEDPAEEIRARAVTFLADRDPEANREVLSQGLEDRSPLVVYCAADAVRELNDQSSIRELGRLLQSENPRIQFIGVLMLGSINEESARGVLREARDGHDDPELRALCGKVLEGRGPDASAFRKSIDPGRAFP